MRKIINFNDNWMFSLGENGGDRQRVSLPHTWNAIDGCDGEKGTGACAEGYYRGVGRYSKSFAADASLRGKRVFIEFEGANTVTDVFLGGELVGSHEGGYAAFRFDLTEKLREGDNLLDVRVDNSPSEHIAPLTDQGDFTKMGGIYRGVKLIAVDEVHIDLMDFGSSGVYITPRVISSQLAEISFRARVTNDSSRACTATVRVELLSIIAEEVVELAAGSTEEVLLTLMLPQPVLWDGVENPHLYSAKISVLRGGEPSDELTQAFGVREYTIDPNEGFILNGRYVDLRGTNYHQDSFESGWAMTNSQRERDYALMREMGCNAVRMAHYQHISHEYDLCDRLGIAVWTEIGIVNKMSAFDSGKVSAAFIDNAKRQLTELIRQNYNHPSVIVWGITNELYQMSEEIREAYAELCALAKREDGTRYTTYADNQGWGEFLSLPADTLGYNKYFGWYMFHSSAQHPCCALGETERASCPCQTEDGSGGAEELGEWLDRYHREKVSKPFCLSEYGGGGAISQHKDNIDWRRDISPWGTPHYENYQSALHEALWAQLSQRRYVWGKFVWCMFDFASDGRNEGDTHGQNDKGLCTRERVRKDAFYFYKSVWSAEPMVHITEKRFTPRPAAVPRVKVYSNAERVELLLNGSSLGSIERSANDPALPTVFVWENVQLLSEAPNELTARADFPNGTMTVDSVQIIVHS